ncbi:Hypothetical_protein [Hexamita inflata]|uniref:Hypothetical_protein n=1 Tax=Hexamita inflata TaxID=28002 RepID=A0ABP1HZD4_9EUKA
MLGNEYPQHLERSTTFPPRIQRRDERPRTAQRPASEAAPPNTGRKESLGASVEYFNFAIHISIYRYRIYLTLLLQLILSGAAWQDILRRVFRRVRQLFCFWLPHLNADLEKLRLETQKSRTAIRRERRHPREAVAKFHFFIFSFIKQMRRQNQSHPMFHFQRTLRISNVFRVKTVVTSTLHFYLFCGD